MSRGTTLATLRSYLKAEIGDYSGTNTTRDAELNLLLANKQRVLATEHDWPFLHQQWDSTLSTNTRFYNLPTTTASNPANETATIDLNKLPEVWVYYSGVWQPVVYGVTTGDYNAFDYANDAVTSDPVQRWRLATNPNETSNPSQFEVWPVPASTQKLRFIGRREVQTLTSDAHKADLDDMLIVLFTAADILMRKKLADAASKLTQANRRLQWLRQGQNVQDVRRFMDGGGTEGKKLVGIKIAVA